MTSSAKEERPHKVGNGAVKNVESDHDEDHEDRSEAKMKPQKHMTAKKSMSSSGDSVQIFNYMYKYII